MNENPPDQPDDFGDVERRLVNARPSFTEPELDKIKLRARTKGSRTSRMRGLRYRGTRMAVALMAFGATAIGGIAAFDVLANASSAQYGTGTTCGSGESYYLGVSGPTTGAKSTSATLGPYTVTLYTCSGTATTPNAIDGNKGVSMPVLLTCTTAAPTPTGGTACSGTQYYSATSGGSSVTYVSIPAASSTATFYFGDNTPGSTVYVDAEGANGPTGYFPYLVPGYEATFIYTTASTYNGSSTSNLVNGTDYYLINGASAGSSTSTANTITEASTTLLTGLTFTIDSTSSTTHSATVGIISGSTWTATALTCSITGGSEKTSCTVSGNVTVPAGDKINIQAVGNGNHSGTWATTYDQ